MSLAAPRTRLLHDRRSPRRRRRRTIALLLAVVATLAGTLLPAARLDAQSESPMVPVAQRPRPSAVYSPRQVVEIQLEALRRNDVPVADAGIATVFAFASPDNQEATGPIERFTTLVKNPAYAPMINHRSAEFLGTEVTGASATQRVRVTTAGGQRVTYVFMLTRQATGRCTGCWLTDGVTRAASPDPDASRPDGLRVTMRERAVDRLSR